MLFHVQPELPDEQHKQKLHNTAYLTSWYNIILIFMHSPAST